MIISRINLTPSCRHGIIRKKEKKIFPRRLPSVDKTNFSFFSQRTTGHLRWLSLFFPFTFSFFFIVVKLHSLRKLFFCTDRRPTVASMCPWIWPVAGLLVPMVKCGVKILLIRSFNYDCEVIVHALVEVCGGSDGIWLEIKVGN